ncbi:MAG: neprosin family prolyl endopeptidase [Terriglobales bacterium]
MKKRMFYEIIHRVQEKIGNSLGSKLALGTTLTLLMLNGVVSAQSAPAKFVPFQNFIDQTTTADASDYLSRPASKVKDAGAFEEMRQHILNTYQDVEVNHSFVLDSAHYDCVPTMQQPAVRKYGITKVATPPPASPLDELARADDAASGPKRALPANEKNPFDAFGNSVQCEENTVAIRRVTLETTTRFQTLKQFFQKSPNEQLPEHKKAFLTPGGPAHKYSLTYQYVNNLGGNSVLNVWDPYVNTSLGEGFSLTQEWYVGGIYSSAPPCGGVESCAIQTEEVGWVVYPGMFGDENPHFFIFSTPNGYASGCWDNSCGDFVVCDGCDGGVIGASLSPVSVLDGAQYESQMRYYFWEGNWWVQFESNWVGYYPGSMYGSGQNSKYAQEIEYGTEGTGTTVWPPEGSGQWPSKGWKYAAYQRSLYYTNTSDVGIWDAVTPDILSPNCYSINGPIYGSGAWNDYFYDGGPGGHGC